MHYQVLWSELHSLQHVLDGTSLGLLSPVKSSSRQTYVKHSVCSTGYFAVKKIAVGESHSYLLKILREVSLSESFFQIFGQRIALGAVTGEITPPKHHHLSSCMVGNFSVFTIWPESPNIAVSTLYPYAISGTHPHIVFSCNGQKEGGKHFRILKRHLLKNEIVRSLASMISSTFVKAALLMHTQSII